MSDQSTQVYEDDFFSCDEEEEDREDPQEEDDDSTTSSYDTAMSSDDYAQILEFIHETIHENVLNMSSPNFDANVIETVKNAFPVSTHVVQELLEEYYSYELLPKRSRATEDACCVTVADDRIDRLRSIPQPEQRTAAWFKFRHNVITASVVSKVFASDAQRNSLIYEKCKPLESSTGSARSSAGSSTNFDSPLHWGQKYEPLSVLIYEHRYKTKVGAFGCLPHPTCKCLAASPDGINVDPLSPRFGRMLEIKNIVNRDITGIPLEAYWVQMQIQMEVCDLDTCDFLETRFREFPNAEEFWYAVDTDSDPEYIGIMLLFLDARYEEHRYEILPIDVSLDIDTVVDWIETVNQRLRREGGWRLFKTIYWYLDELSCVLVDRNRMWFEKARPVIEATWATIEQERIHGCEHRAPVKRTQDSGDAAAAARSKAALAQLFSAAEEDCIVEAIQSDLSVNDLSRIFLL
jgi:hypothetical protein